MNLGKLAATLPLPFLDARENVDLAVRCEKEWGYDAIWLAETNGHDSFSLAAAAVTLTLPVPGVAAGGDEADSEPR